MSSTYKSPLVSCIICRAEKSAKGIFSHFIVSHTERGKQRVEQSTSQRTLNATLAANIRKQTRIDEYNKNPNKCKHCGKSLLYAKRNNTCCTQSCAASYNNARRPEMTIAQRELRSNKMKQLYPNGIIRADAKPDASWQTARVPYSKFSICTVCDTIIKFKHSTVCSTQCKSIHNSIRMIEHIKRNKRSNFRRDKQSYLEQSFEDWVQTIPDHPQFIPEYTIKNTDTNKWYFVDFYFPSCNLIVELDGKQHLKPDHIERDRVRDEFITHKLGITVFRISHDEYQAGTKINQLLEIMVPHRGNDPRSQS